MVVCSFRQSLSGKFALPASESTIPLCFYLIDKATFCKAHNWGRPRFFLTGLGGFPIVPLLQLTLMMICQQGE
jgi:hypothetical protein